MATGKIYLQRINCTEDEVNELIAQGYIPQFITPKTFRVNKNGNLVNVMDELVYHFIKRKSKEEVK